ncbi:hypothetical protein HYPSUDRAFT_200259 [Hypholoma sublateritium FD-334 SS-4]|uniref:Uncharacterized protein n=1 Tax=Hypholoma sublateritium (strain FD-334 SS-4) TaxID=945553 RepID=A0A0D2MLK4_HYPSF|nr:hypothetical protein HYPSUDRAFT_200259 [Hypholoma sublateritium FD-334 SS-4]
MERRRTSVHFGRAALYALVEPSGSSALMNVGAGTVSAVCSWKTYPKLVHVQTKSKRSTSPPARSARTTAPCTRRSPDAGRMTQAGRLFGAGANCRPPIMTLGFYQHALSATQVLATLLADDGKASMTAYSIHEWHGK